MTDSGRIEIDVIHHGLAANESRQLARRLLRLRQERRRHFTPVDVTGPAWDLVLVLFGLPGAERDLCVGDLSARAAIPRTTTVRWVRQLEKHGFVSLFDDRKDKRAVRVQLTPAGERAVEATLMPAALKVR